MKLNLGASDRAMEGFLSVDICRLPIRLQTSRSRGRGPIRASRKS